MAKLRAPVLACAALICAAQAASAQDQDVNNRPDPCADLGSFAMIDPPGSGRGTLTAQSYTPCADLGGGRQRDSVQIGVDVMIGGQNAEASGMTPSRRRPNGQQPRLRP